MDSFRFDEKYLSQIPALQVLINLGYQYLAPAEALAARGGKLSQVLLEEILREQLKKLNRIQHKGSSYLFSEENIQSAIQRLKNVKYDGLLKTNEAVYDLLTLGVALEQSIEGDQKSFTLNYVDWRNPENNVYHVAAEFAVERTRSHETVRPDLVLFVNGIPFAVIECKSPKEDLEQAVTQMIRNQRDEFIPKLFTYAQAVFGVNKNNAKYATIGTPKKFWATWKESIQESELLCLLEQERPDPAKADLFDAACKNLGVREDITPYMEDRTITEQDRALYALCRPERLLRMAFAYTVFDGGLRKIARYQQFFAVQKIMARIKERDETGQRRGGIIWHTQGSGKSLTMVMLARALVLDADIPNPRIILVTDRVDLDKQLGNTFAACGLAPERAESGRHLLELLTDHKAHVITTLIHKFEKALNTRKDFFDDSTEVFVLVDESHRTNFGSLAANMRRFFPKACYLGFTGTPLMKGEKKNSFAKFGGLIDPPYTIKQAVDDGAVVPLLYEARLVEMQQNKAAIDLWFERHTNGLTEAQKADLKRKYSRAEMLSKTDQVIYMEAFDISEHYRESWQGTGYKAQLVARSKAAALKFKAYLDEIGQVTSEVIMSPPDEREGYEEVDSDEATDEVVAFWNQMMKRYGSEEEYNKQIVNQFKFGDSPEILIVIDKLLTGFDAPKNTVLYLTRLLKEHTLLQAIARVNRLYEDERGGSPKEFGYIIDYRGILGELDKALTAYSGLEGFDEEDLQGALTSIQEEVKQLPQRHGDLWDLFKEVKNRKDEEAFELFLKDEEVRIDFYSRLSIYAKTLAIALSSEKFLAETNEAKVRAYKEDLKNFKDLKASVQRRYAESVDYRDFEPKIQKLLDTHITANEVVRLNEPVNIFDSQALKQVLEDQGHGSTSAKADTIAYATKRAIHEQMAKDPAFFERFSKLIQDAIDAFRAQRISDLEYLNQALEIRDAMVNRKTDAVPSNLQGDDDAIALYGILKPIFEKHLDETSRAESLTSDAALNLVQILKAHAKVNYWDDLDAQKETKNAIDDFLFEEMKDASGIPLTPEEMDEIIEKTMTLARHRLVV